MALSSGTGWRSSSALTAQVFDALQLLRRYQQEIVRQPALLDIATALLIRLAVDRASAFRCYDMMVLLFSRR